MTAIETRKAYSAPQLDVIGSMVELTAGGSNNPSPEGTNQGVGAADGCKNPGNQADRTRNRC